MDTKRYIVKWLLMMGLSGRALTRPRDWLSLLFAVVLVGGCYAERRDRADPDLILIDDIQVIDNVTVIDNATVVDTTPAQYVKTTYSDGGRTLDVKFDKQPTSVSVHGAADYALSGTELRVRRNDCRRLVVVRWEGAQKTFNDWCPPPSPATAVVVKPRPGSTIPPNQEFNLEFNLGVTSATVNGVAATGSHMTWRATPGLKEGVVTLKIEWTSRDGSAGSAMVGPYTVRDE